MGLGLVDWFLVFGGFDYGVGWFEWLFEFADLVSWFMVGVMVWWISVCVACGVVFSSWSFLVVG